MTKCEKLHKYFNGLKRYSYPFNANEIIKNGIYIFFEKGELYKNYDRIVRVGTHTGENNLPIRLKEHLEKENKDRSIFRKNIGRALLNKNNDPFIEQWNWDLTSKKDKEKYSDLIDVCKLKQTEEQVSAYMRENLSFCVIPIETKVDRLFNEERIISTIANAPDFKSSENWLGNFSPEAAIRQSGLWLKKGLDAPQLTDDDVEKILNL